jgi:hypothetical protein
MQSTIIGIVTPGTPVVISHPGHPHNGERVTVRHSNGATGGIAGGGAVNVAFDEDEFGWVSRYTRVTPEIAPFAAHQSAPCIHPGVFAVDSETPQWCGKCRTNVDASDL